MNRLFIVTIIGLISLDSAVAEAKWPGRLWRSNPSNFGFIIGGNRADYGNYGYAGNGSFGYPGTFPANGYGFGYLYDPYATGSFKAPDLLNDPYFRAQTKFDSQFPGRYAPRRPVHHHRAGPATFYHQ